MENLYQHPVVLKVLNGTLRSDVHLCLTCRLALHVQASNSGREALICSAVYGAPLTITGNVGRCTGYIDRTKPSLQDMNEIAWQLMTDKGGRKIGFLSPEELRERSQPGAPPTTPGFGS